MYRGKWLGHSSVLVCLMMLFTGGCSNGSHSYRFFTENDSYHPVERPDANYTSGLLFMASPAKQYLYGDNKRIDHLNFIDPSEEGLLEVPVTVEYGIGQIFYTPDDIAVDTLSGIDRNGRVLSEDRPYAGLLFFQGAIHNHLSNGDAARDRRQSVFGKIGLTGGGSLAEDMHTAVHEERDLIIPTGWGMQVGQEIAFAAGVEQHDRLFKWKHKMIGVDVLSNVKATVGTIYTGLEGGITVRAGFNLPSTIQQSTIHEAIVKEDGSEEMKRPLSVPDGNWHLYFFLGHRDRWVLRDFALDGRAFSSDQHTVEKEPFVNETQYGGQLRIAKNWTIQALFAHRSRQFKSQRKEHSFGQYMISYQQPIH